MTEVPKVVHQRLRAAEHGPLAAQTHPDADVLAAFAEQVLAGPERENVLAHLALCADCRGAVLLALPTEVAAVSQEAETAAAVTPVEQQTWRNWFADLFTSNWRLANLRWAALAAGVAVAIFFVHSGLEHSGNSGQPVVASQKARPTEPTAPVAAEVPPQVSSGEVKKPAEIKPELPSVHAKAMPALKPGPAAKVQPGAAPALTASNKGAQPALPNNPAPASSGSQFPGAQIARQQTAVEVSAASPPLDTASPSSIASPSTQTMLAENRMPSVEKAKPALSEASSEIEKKDTVASAPAASQGNLQYAGRAAFAPLPTLKQGTLWKIGTGVLQRSFDGGQTWQPVLQAERPWLCYAARGREIWAGGPAGALQHSLDDGASWNAVEVAYQGQSLGADVTRIDVLSATELVLMTATRETWASSDGGRSWEKK